VSDFNKDGYPDIATSKILMDENDCKDTECYIPINPEKPNDGKYLLKRSYHHLWNPEAHNFDNPVKAEIFYMKNGSKVIVKS
jgi:hypothetical protein